MPGHLSNSESKVVYSGTALTPEEEQEAADRATQAKAEYIQSLGGKGILSQEGIVIQA